jgi:hypothetical protein
MTAPNPPRNPPFSPRTLAALVLVLAVVAGGLAGVVLDRLVLLPHAFGRPPRIGPANFRDRFAHAVGLTSAQQERVDSITRRRFAELRGIREQVRPRVDSVLARMRSEIDSVLTPEQRRRAIELRARDHGPGGRRKRDHVSGLGGWRPGGGPGEAAPPDMGPPPEGDSGQGPPR